ncbi:MAG TPA: glycosyltransferase family 4 protein [Pyrinomonadaceae bacterium]|nr:glycosyltransferase family 4 protein [Pyrinomonadaceae bacterium]
MSDTAPIILVSPDMRPSVMGVARSLVGAGLLQRFVTTVAVGNGNDPGLLTYLPEQLQKTLRSKLSGRTIPDYLNVPVETFPSREMINLAGRRAGVGDIAAHRLWEWAETSFDKQVATRWAGRAPVIYGCEHASVETFKRQKEAGGLNILWQVIAHHGVVYELLKEEYERFPEAMTPYVSRMFLDAERINQRKDEQFESADLIVTNSEFSRRTFVEAGLPPDKVTSIPTGCPPVVSIDSLRTPHSKMIFLCAGTQSIRKGTQYLLEAWKQLSPKAAELWIVGKMELPKHLLANLPESVVIKPSVPREELAEIFGRADVLVLPTLGEGLAHIILEAMSAGLAIVTTENSGCGDFVEDGVNGWKVPIRDVNQLANRLQQCIDGPDLVKEMGRSSTTKARQWQEADFATAHANVITKFLSEHLEARDPLLQPVSAVAR